MFENSLMGYAMRTKQYRFIVWKDRTNKDVEPVFLELYDHKTDPHEWHNLASSPEHLAAKQQLARWLPQEWAPTAATKSAFEFDPQSFSWIHKKTGTITDGK